MNEEHSERFFENTTVDETKKKKKIKLNDMIRTFSFKN